MLDFPTGPANRARRSDFNSLIDAISGNGIHNGMTVSANGTGLGVNVAAGSYTTNGTKVQYVGATPAVTLSTADPTNARIDIIVADSSGVISAVAGIASASPDYPAIPSGKIRLAIINVTAGLVTLLSGNVYDAQVMIPISKGSATISVSTSSVTVSDRAIKTGAKVFITSRNSPAWSNAHTHTMNFNGGGTFSFNLVVNGIRNEFVKSGGAVNGITGIQTTVLSNEYFWVDTVVDGTSFKINTASNISSTTVVNYIIMN